MIHIVLLGDSVFDNASYVERRREVLEKVKSRLPPEWRATLNAQDGAVIADVRRQAERAPQDATHLVISAGGNDALRSLGVLNERVSSVVEALARLETIRRQFWRLYREMLDEVLRLGLPTAICTIYEGRFPDAQSRLANTGLAMLNDVITREAAARGVPVIDLRVLFDDDADFANAIEPSAQGGEKLAQVVVQLVAKHDFIGGECRLYAKARNAPVR
jgi:GDSL-like Lipase/Acylhydrolase family